MTADFQRCVLLIRAAAGESFDAYEGVSRVSFQVSRHHNTSGRRFPAAGTCQFCRRRMSTAAIQNVTSSPGFCGWVDRLPSSKNTSSFSIWCCCRSALIPVHHSNPTHTQRCLHLSNFPVRRLLLFFLGHGKVWKQIISRSSLMEGQQSLKFRQD